MGATGSSGLLLSVRQQAISNTSQAARSPITNKKRWGLRQPPYGKLMMPQDFSGVQNTYSPKLAQNQPVKHIIPQIEAFSYAKRQTDFMKPRIPFCPFGVLSYESKIYGMVNYNPNDLPGVIPGRFHDRQGFRRLSAH
ncbi:MAG: hypothetical protein AB1500_04730 [Bacillota bacterium]